MGIRCQGDQGIFKSKVKSSIFLRMKVREATIREIADLLLCGQLCFLNTTTGDVEYYPAVVKGSLQR